MSDPCARWDDVQRAFESIEEAPESERAARLSALAPDIRVEVESLREAAVNAPAFLNLPDRTARAGSTLGPYRLGDEIGRGGMGVVYRAERGDGEFTRSVALKIASGQFFAPELERRFIRERQILAQLDHPNIVRLLDGGVTNGQRYFVMELTEGTPLTAYCRESALDVPARLELFREVCAAIHYAHQRLILHRDLKPGNIVVTAQGTVKVLDFGVAQLVRPDDGTPGGEATATSVHPYSLSCASPEQLRGERLSLASDIYSLGVLLYEVLTGVNPQYRNGDTFDRTYRRVIGEEPARPSAVATGLARDLDAIALKALAKIPEERYASVAELDADIERFTSGRPVLAVPPRASYVAARFVRRNRALTGAVVALLVVATVGAAAYVRQAHRERRRFEDARKLVHSVIFELQPKLEGIAGTLAIRQTLIEQTMAYLESVSADAGNDVPLLQELSNAYRELARLQGDVSVSNLGNFASAAQRFVRADQLMQRALAIQPANPSLLSDAGTLYSRISGFDGSEGRTADQLAHARLAVRYAEENFKLRPREFESRDLVALTKFYLALAMPDLEWEAKVTTFREAAETYETLAKEYPTNDHLPRNAAITFRYVASIYADREDFAKSLGFARRSLEATEVLLAPRPTDIRSRLDVATSARLLALWTSSARDVSGAQPLFERAIAIYEDILKQDAANVRARQELAHAVRGFAQNRLDAGDRVAARVHVYRALDLYAQLVERGQAGAGQANLRGALARTQGNLERLDGNHAAACAAFTIAQRHYEEAERQDPMQGAGEHERDDVIEKLKGCRG
jgi:eukaryotic-like serine/threonine-protein kinase